MTDLNSLKDMLERADIEYKMNPYKKDEDSADELWIEKGYAGFVTIFSFDEHGKLVDVGAYE